MINKTGYISFQLIVFEIENAELSIQFTENKRYKIVIVKTDIKMKFSIFTNLRTSQLDTIDTALTQSLLCAVISIKANGEEKIWLSTSLLFTNIKR